MTRSACGRGAVDELEAARDAAGDRLGAGAVELDQSEAHCHAPTLRRARGCPASVRSCRPPTPRPSVPELIDIWQSALETVVALGAATTDEQWRLPTPCPGWSVGDVVAHLVDIEQMMAGSPRPDHEPDWSSLAARAGRLRADHRGRRRRRRAQPREDVLAELQETIEPARSQLDAVPDGAEVIGPFGNPTTHGPAAAHPDLRHLGASAGHPHCPGAWTTAGTRPRRPCRRSRSCERCPYVWARTVGAPEGATVRIEITDPSLSARRRRRGCRRAGRASTSRRVRTRPCG